MKSRLLLLFAALAAQAPIFGQGLTYTFDFGAPIITGPQKVLFTYTSSTPTSPGTSLTGVKATIGSTEEAVIADRASNGFWSFNLTDRRLTFEAQTDVNFANVPGSYSAPARLITQTGVQFQTVSITIVPAGGPPMPAISAVVNAGSGLASLSPGALVSIYGRNLSALVADAPAGGLAGLPGEFNLPLSLGGVTVTVGGIAAPLRYVSPGQINAQIPFEVPVANPSVIVTSGGFSSAGFSLALRETSPGLITRDGKNALVISPDSRVRDSIKSGDTIVMYAVGLGPTSPATATGAAGAGAEPLNRVVTMPRLQIGGVDAKILFAGMAPLFPGIYQINAVVPDLPENDQVSLADSAGRGSSNTVLFANGRAIGSGTITLLYPTGTSKVAFSPMLVAADLSASGGISTSSNSAAFKVVATISGSTAKAVYMVSGGFLAGQPRIGWSGTWTEPTAAERAWDFSLSNYGTLDFLSGVAFPGNVIPLSRVDPAAVSVIQDLPVSTSQSATTPSTPSWRTSTKFGGYLLMSSQPASHTVPVTANLYIDGVLESTQTINVATIP